MFYVKISVVFLCVLALVYAGIETSQTFRSLCNVIQIHKLSGNYSSRNTVVVVQHNVSSFSDLKQRIQKSDSRLLQYSSRRGNDQSTHINRITTSINRQTNKGLCLKDKRSENESWYHESFFSRCVKRMKVELQLPQIQCPSACVTIAKFGGFNNNIIQLQNTIEHHIPHNKFHNSAVASITLHENLDHSFTSNFDPEILRKLCIFPQTRNTINSSSCRKIDGSVSFYRKFRHKPTWKKIDRDLILTWLITASVSKQVYEDFDVQSKLMPKTYIAIHARFLEGSCRERHTRMKASTKYCDFKPTYLSNKIKMLGANGTRIVIFWDKQEEYLVRTAANSLNASISLNQNVIVDMLLMIQANYFIGNQVSTVSYNVDKIRLLLYGSNANSLML